MSRSTDLRPPNGAARSRQLQIGGVRVHPPADISDGLRAYPNPARDLPIRQTLSVLIGQ